MSIFHFEIAKMSILHLEIERKKKKKANSSVKSFDFLKKIIKVFTVLGECERENTEGAGFRDFLDFVTEFPGFFGILGDFYVANIFVWKKKKKWMEAAKKCPGRDFP